MSDKRRDSKNRVLRSGESQRKDGRYMYKYGDGAGNIKYAYSWRLVETDAMPRGKPPDIPLRDKIKAIQKEAASGIFSGKTTVYELVEKYIAQKTGVRHNTEANYRFVLNIVGSEGFGKRQIKDVKLSDAKEWLIKLQGDGKGYSTVKAVRGVVRPAFQMAVDDDMLPKNPFQFELAGVVVNDSATREAVSRKQERAFLDFVRNDRHFSRYYEPIYILFNTGLRISEFCGLTVSDIDMAKKTIAVSRQLQRKRDGEYVIEDVKTANSDRLVPMTDEVRDCFRRAVESRKAPLSEPAVEGVSGFLYLDKNGMPKVALHWEKYFQRIREKYNKTYKEELPEITPHVCRHTFCSNMAKSGMNPKALQKIMGHSDIQITLNTYTHLDYGDVESEMKAVSSRRKREL